MRKWPAKWAVKPTIKWLWCGVIAAVSIVAIELIHFYQPKHYLYRLFDAPNLPSILLVLLGIGGIWAALRTLTTIEKQVDAMVNTERAWMEVDVELGPSSAVVEVTDGQQPTVTVVSVAVKWLNVGRTPAWINLTQIGMIMLPDETKAPAALPEPGDLSVIGPEMVAADKDFSQTGTVKGEGKITREQIGLIYGKVSYFDIYRKYHVTTFGFIVDDNRRVRRLPFLYPAYNEHT
jgi:hypothetical protein